MTKTITIPEDLRDRVQNADIECSARRDIITNIITNGAIEPTNEFFQKYQDEYNKSYFAFEKAKSEVEQNYVKKNYPDATNWNLNYNTCQVTITI